MKIQASIGISSQYNISTVLTGEASLQNLHELMRLFNINDVVTYSMPHHPYILGQC